mmetsp:Transcript_16879/g.64279  ORF Transcript_16879/g.64279 Transcript_16879/m.64279 type:complete len:346 (+) Transcript_16879:1183-2220(+)|eukprot:scaffold1975_cov241-Pinguiococcus_pyrenoidosus.AAC.3
MRDEIHGHVEGLVAIGICEGLRRPQNHVFGNLEQRMDAVVKAVAGPVPVLHLQIAKSLFHRILRPRLARGRNTALPHGAGHVGPSFPEGLLLLYLLQARVAFLYHRLQALCDHRPRLLGVLVHGASESLCHKDAGRLRNHPKAVGADLPQLPVFRAQPFQTEMERVPGGLQVLLGARTVLHDVDESAQAPPAEVARHLDVEPSLDHVGGESLHGQQLQCEGLHGVIPDREDVRSLRFHDPAARVHRRCEQVLFPFFDLSLFPHESVVAADRRHVLEAPHPSLCRLRGLRHHRAEQSCRQLRVQPSAKRGVATTALVSGLQDVGQSVRDHAQRLELVVAVFALDLV